jgi:hypothetical protein
MRGFLKVVSGIVIVTGIAAFALGVFGLFLVLHQGTI